MSNKSTPNGIEHESITLDFASGVMNAARLRERRGDKRGAMHSYAHALRAASSSENIQLANQAREELFSTALVVNDTIFTSALYRELISTYSKQDDYVAACAHHDLGKIFRNSWQHGELLNPSEAIKHLVAARDIFVALWEARDSALAEMDLAHIYVHIDKVDQALVLLESAQATWRSLNEIVGAAECNLSIGDCLTILGKNDKAVLAYKQAAEDFESAGNHTQAVMANERVDSDLV